MESEKGLNHYPFDDQEFISFVEKKVGVFPSRENLGKEIPKFGPVEPGSIESLREVLQHYYREFLKRKGEPTENIGHFPWDDQEFREFCKDTIGYFPASKESLSIWTYWKWPQEKLIQNLWVIFLKQKEKGKEIRHTKPIVQDKEIVSNQINLKGFLLSLANQL